MVVVPGATRFATPEFAVRNVATAGFDELQVGVTVDPLLVAVNVTDPMATLAVKEGAAPPQPLQAIVSPEEEPTVRVVVAVTPLWVAVMVVVPAVFAAVASPELLMLAMFVEEELHVTDEVTLFVLLSPNVPVAENCWVAPN
jgi:hypothetical protein